MAGDLRGISQVFERRKTGVPSHNAPPRTLHFLLVALPLDFLLCGVDLHTRPGREAHISDKCCSITIDLGLTNERA